MGRVRVHLYGECFSSLRPKERIWDASLADKILGLASNMGYKKTTECANSFLHRSDSEAMSYKTVEEFVERTGTRIDTAYRYAADSVLSDFCIDKDTCIPGKDSLIPDNAVKPDGITMADEDEVRELAEQYNEKRDERDQIPVSQMNALPEGKSDDCVYIYVDDVLVKQQKEERKPDSKRSSKFVANTVITIQHDGGKYRMSAKCMLDAFKRLMAFLLSSHLMEDRMLVFISDGATEIKDYIWRYFGFRPYVLYLDWFHLRQKCYQYLSSALKCGKKMKDDKNRIERELYGILWTGNTEGAVKYIDSIDSKFIKSQDHIIKLKDYIERKKDNIPCYAIRKGLGLPNSSNPVEKTNDLAVAKRQKGKGMAWSAEGSVALAAVTISGMNGERCNLVMGMPPRFTLAV